MYRAHHNYDLTPYNPPPLPADYEAKLTRKTPAPERQRTNAAAAGPLRQPSVTTPQRDAVHLPPDPIRNRPPLPFDPDPDTIGSTNVPMDSWIYPALERLAAMGLIPDRASPFGHGPGRSACANSERQRSWPTERMTTAQACWPKRTA